MTKAAVLATAIAVSACVPSLADDLTGSARVIDGDTIAVGSRHVRLQGIDAPETDQVCLGARGERWTCGIAAREHLSSHIAGRAITCAARGEDRYGRMLATCSAGGENLNAWIVREGWALAYVRYSGEYVADEADARAQHRGMWAGAFIAPVGLAAPGQEHRDLGRCGCSSLRASPTACPGFLCHCPVAGLHHQGQRQPARRAHLPPAGTSKLCHDQHGDPSKAVVLFRGRCTDRWLASSRA
jgi:endonuclease YncB( thermonuclease family)